MAPNTNPDSASAIRHYNNNHLLILYHMYELIRRGSGKVKHSAVALNDGRARRAGETTIERGGGDGRDGG
eukprot:3440707-Pyramimonas_sp.AAC.1